MKFLRFLPVFLLMLFGLETFAQKRILDRAEKSIFQLDYQLAKADLKLYLEKNDNQENNCYKLLFARIYGDPESPYFDPDSAYRLMTKVQYYPATFDPKTDVVICKSYEACVDTVSARKDQYAKSILNNAIETGRVSALKEFINQYSIHDDLVEKATDLIYELEFETVKKKNTLLLYSQFIENYPKAPQVPEARELMVKVRYDRAVRINAVKEYKRFLEEHPGSQYEEDIIQRIEDVRWDYCLRGNSVHRYIQYLEHYPESKHKEEAEENISEIQWKQVKEVDEVAYYRWFVRTYPKHDGVKYSEQRIQDLRWQEASAKNSIESYRSYLSEFPKTSESKTAKKLIERLELEQNEESEEHSE